jgi:hypothetical protein
VPTLPLEAVASGLKDIDTLYTRVSSYFFIMFVFSVILVSRFLRLEPRSTNVVDRLSTYA